MSLLSMFSRRKSAPVARDRLKILLAHERSAGGSDLAAILRDEVLEVVKKHIAIEPENVHVKLERGIDVSVLEVDIEIPTPNGEELPVPEAESEAA